MIAAVAVICLFGPCLHGHKTFVLKPPPANPPRCELAHPTVIETLPNGRKVCW
jgi:hypothetical protein